MATTHETALKRTKEILGDASFFTLIDTQLPHFDEDDSSPKECFIDINENITLICSISVSYSHQSKSYNYDCPPDITTQWDSMPLCKITTIGYTDDDIDIELDLHSMTFEVLSLESYIENTIYKTYTN